MADDFTIGKEWVLWDTMPGRVELMDGSFVDVELGDELLIGDREDVVQVFEHRKRRLS